MDKRFYSNFLNYLDEEYARDYSKDYTALLFQGRRPLLPEKFTMGNIAFTARSSFLCVYPYVSDETGAAEIK